MSGDEASKNDDEEFGTKKVFITLLLGFLHKFFLASLPLGDDGESCASRSSQVTSANCLMLLSLVRVLALVAEEPFPESQSAISLLLRSSPLHIRHS